MKLYSMSGSGKTAVPRGRGSCGGSVFHTCSCKNSVTGGGSPLLLSPDLGVSVGGGMSMLRQKLDKMTLAQPKRKKYISF